MKESFEEAEQVGITLERGIKIKADWAQLASKIGEAALGSSAGGIGGIPALISALSSLSIETPLGDTAWTLSILSFGFALNELTSASEDTHPAIKTAIKGLVESARQQVDGGSERMPLEFLERPTTLHLYRSLREATVSRKSLFRQNIDESDDTFRARLDAAFNRAVFEILIRKPDVYSRLLNALDRGKATAISRDANWNSYRARLIYDFDVRAIFGQDNTKLSLGQLYIPLRCYWNDAQETPDTNPFSASSRQISMLDKQLEDWLDSSSDDDAIRLIGGGPGSGKSTTLRALARRTAARLDWRPLFIPLQHIELDGDLRDAINRYFTDRSHGCFSTPPLSRSAVEDGPPFLLIFDGLDELARPGEAANEVVSLFSTKLANLVSSLIGDGSKSLRVVVSGRMPSFQAARRFISPPREGCLEVYGFAPPEDIIRRQNDLWRIDQRPQWWEQYAKLIGAPTTVPEAFTSPSLANITHEPLLCYLLALSGFATSNWEKAAENPNRIYQSLVDSIWDRGWGEGQIKRQGPGRTLSKADFNTLMQTIALAAWQGGDTRVASETGFLSAIKIARAEDAWESFQRDNGTDVTNLALNFYLKTTEIGSRGFEFTHKSFGDYLAARAILEIALDLPALATRNIEHALTDWVAATGSGILTSEILTFLRDEMRLRASESGGIYTSKFVSSNKRTFEVLIGAILRDGLPSHSSSKSWRVAERRQYNSELMAWAMANSYTLCLFYMNEGELSLDIEWPDARNSLRQLILRWSSVGADFRTVALKCLSFISAPRADLSELTLDGADLRGSNLQGSDWSYTRMSGGDLAAADISDSEMYKASFSSMVIEETDFRNSQIWECEFRDIDWVTSDMRGTDLTPHTILFTDLEFLRSKVTDITVTNTQVSTDQEGVKITQYTSVISDRLQKVRNIIKTAKKSRHSLIVEGF